MNKRLYNGPQSKLMDAIYDNLILRAPMIVNEKWWVSNSIYIARACCCVEKKMEKEYDKQENRLETQEDIDEYLKEAKEYLENQTPEEARQFLQDAGIYDKDGNLTEKYGG